MERFEYKPKTRFNPDAYIDCAYQLLEHDEPLKAIELLSALLPAFWRDNVPKEIQALKNAINGRLMLVHDYAKNPYDTYATIERSITMCTQIARGVIITEQVKAYNEKGLTPHIVDMGPGDYWVPMGLRALGCKFTYEPFGVHLDAEAKALKDFKAILIPSCYEPMDGLSLIQARQKHESFIGDRPVVFLACEIIEHLLATSEIRCVFDRIPNPKAKVIVSTPLYNFDKSRIFEDMVGLGHVRAYTPREFQLECMKLFPEYKWTYYHSDAMTLVGEL